MQQFCEFQYGINTVWIFNVKNLDNKKRYAYTFFFDIKKNNNCNNLKIFMFILSSMKTVLFLFFVMYISLIITMYMSNNYIDV